jgi:hypothetical protein
MNWLKRNLFLVIGSAVTLLLLGLAGFYLITQIDKESTVSEQLETQMNDWRRLTTASPASRRKTSPWRALNRRNWPTCSRKHALLRHHHHAHQHRYLHLPPSARYHPLRSRAERPSPGRCLAPDFAFTVDWVRRSVVFDQSELLPLAISSPRLRPFAKCCSRPGSIPSSASAASRSRHGMLVPTTICRDEARHQRRHPRRGDALRNHVPGLSRLRWPRSSTFSSDRLTRHRQTDRCRKRWPATRPHRCSCRRPGPASALCTASHRPRGNHRRRSHAQIAMVRLPGGARDPYGGRGGGLADRYRPTPGVAPLPFSFLRSAQPGVALKPCSKRSC